MQLSCLATASATDLPTPSPVGLLPADHCKLATPTSSLPHSDDFNRVKLKAVEGEEGSDYINASFVDVSHFHCLLQLGLSLTRVYLTGLC